MDISDNFYIFSLPTQAGIYKFLDKKDKIIYVGKAKSIRKRVASYFTKNHPSFKTKLLVDRICSIEYIVTDTESDALLLENNLIKKLQPAYNVMLKDDKTYPWIVIKNEDFPRVFYTRQKNNDGSEFLGPFTSVYMVKTLLSLIRKLYPLRTCNLRLSPENIKSGKFRVCLQFHIGNCKGPCEGRISKSEYQEFVRAAQKIVRGDLHEIQDFLNDKMRNFSAEYKFEAAAAIKEKLDIIENYKAKSTIVNPRLTNLDVFAIAKDINTACVNYLRVQNGAVIQAHTIELRQRIEENDQDLLLTAITEIRNRLNSKNKEIIVPLRPEFELPNIKWVIPQRGDRLKLLELSQRNARLFLIEKNKRIEKTDPERHSKRKMETLKSDLNLKELPEHIECFDISGIQGTNTAGSCIVFRNTKPSKKDYRLFNIKTVEGQDDFASMKEVVFRRYNKIKQEKGNYPQLIIIDGGKGQLSAAVSALKELGIYGKSAIIGIAKRLEEIYFPGDSVPIYLDKNSESLKTIQQARNEAHRFVINFHRKKRSDQQLCSELNNIKGIGSKTAEKLLKKFGSVENLRKADQNAIAEITGSYKAQIIVSHFCR
jgi:excinuclease ABC subunit C